ncbi:MAG: GNAT family N-acetyltransferase [Candidatus Limnocylindrales bacterium]
MRLPRSAVMPLVLWIGLAGASVLAAASRRPSAAALKGHVVRRIGPQEGALLKALRLRALAEEPEAFGESVAEAEARDEIEYVARARAASDGDRRAWFLAETSPDAAPIGLAMGRRRPPDECMVFSVWVTEAARRQGVGRALVGAVADWARGWDARSLVLWVYRSNRRAIAFYERLGFLIEPSGPDTDLGAPHDAVAMHLAL